MARSSITKPRLRARTINWTRLLLRSPAVAVGEDTILCQTLRGDMIYVDRRDHSVAKPIIDRGTFEAMIDRVIRSRVRPGMRVMDVGANFGLFTLTMASALGGSGHIHAVEANPEVLDLLRRTIAVNRIGERVTVHPFAASRAPGLVTFKFDPVAIGGGKVSVGALSPEVAWQTVVVPARTIDDMLPDGAVIDFVKMDIEGGEADAIAGMERTLARSPKIAMVIEFYPPHMDRGPAPLEHLQRLARLGFALRVIDWCGVSQALTPEQVMAAFGNRLMNLLLER